MERKILYKNLLGEYTPYNSDDILLAEWCQEYNKKIRKGKAGYLQSPIQTNLIYYVTPYPHDKKLAQWCEIQNNELKRKRREAKTQKCGVA